MKAPPSCRTEVNVSSSGTLECSAFRHYARLGMTVRSRRGERARSIRFALGAALPMLITTLSTHAAEGQWRASVEKDAITDVRKATFRIAALSLTRGTIGTRVRPTLFFRCNGGSVSDLFVNVGAFITDDDPVFLRFDGNPAVGQYWTPSTDNTALFARDESAVLDSILMHERMLFRFTPYRESDETTSFLLTGLAAHDALLRQHCGFTVQERRLMIREKRTPSAVAAAKERAEAVARARAQEATDSITALATPSRDSTLPWVSRFSHDIYYRNVPACRALLDVHITWMIFWRTEEGAAASNRRRSRDPGC
jgi:hypothetical protein